jgi:putative flippase GtrA
LKFIIVGLLAVTVNWYSRLAITDIATFDIAILIAYPIGMAVAFVLNRFFVFPKNRTPIKIQVRRFIIINLAFIPIVWLCAIGLNQWFISYYFHAHSEDLAHAIALALPMLLTFLMYKFLVFR